MLTFRTSITFAVMVFIVALAVLLIAIQVRALRWATQDAASAYMDETSTKAFGRLQTEITDLAFSIAARAITVSAPLRGKVSGVLAADLKLDSFSDSSQNTKRTEG